MASLSPKSFCIVCLFVCLCVQSSRSLVFTVTTYQQSAWLAPGSALSGALSFSSSHPHPPRPRLGLASSVGGVDARRPCKDGTRATPTSKGTTLGSVGVAWVYVFFIQPLFGGVRSPSACFCARRACRVRVMRTICACNTKKKMKKPSYPACSSISTFFTLGWLRRDVLEWGRACVWPLFPFLWHHFSFSIAFVFHAASFTSSRAAFFCCRLIFLCAACFPRCRAEFSRQDAVTTYTNERGRVRCCGCGRA